LIDSLLAIAVEETGGRRWQDPGAKAIAGQVCCQTWTGSIDVT